MNCRLPSYNFDEFVAHVKKGPGFGCWTIGQVRKAWGKRKRVTARDMAKYIAGREIFSYHETRVLCSMLPREAWKKLYRHMGIPAPVPSLGLDAYCKLRGFCTVWDIAPSVLEITKP